MNGSKYAFHSTSYVVSGMCMYDGWFFSLSRFINCKHNLIIVTILQCLTCVFNISMARYFFKTGTALGSFVENVFTVSKFYTLNLQNCAQGKKMYGREGNTGPNQLRVHDDKFDEENNGMAEIKVQ